MADQAIVEWLRRYINAGYNTNQLKTTLLQHGYTEKQIEDAFQTIYPAREVKHVIHFSKTTIAMIIALIFTLILISGGLFYFFSSRSPDQLLDVSTDIIKQSVLAGEKLEFNLELTSLGAAKRYDVDVTYDIEKDNQQITFKQETVGLETSKSYKTFVDIPLTAEPGDYALKTTARYDGKIARATSSFKVYLKTDIPTCFDNIQNQGELGIDCGPPCQPCPSCSDNIQNQGELGIDCGPPCQPCATGCNDNNDCTTDQLVNGQCQFIPITPCCGNGKCEENENCAEDCPTDDPFASLNVFKKLEAIAKMAETDEAKAASYCNTFENQIHIDRCYNDVAEGAVEESYCANIDNERNREECYVTIALKSETTTICANIAKETIKDRCYMQFVTAALDYTVCDKVSDYYLKRLCESMRDINEMPEGMPEYYFNQTNTSV